MSIIRKLSQHTDENTLIKSKHIHFIGIGGSGMCGLAEILLNQGYRVSGSDLKDSNVTDRLIKLGAKIYFQHEAHNIENSTELVVVSSAIEEDNPEYNIAKKKNLSIIPRAKMLALLSNQTKNMLVAGSHGKTTTTTLLALILAEAGLDPTYVVGGLVNNIDTNAHLGKSEYLIAEADESDGSFLMLKPKMAILTNIDTDHLWFYENDFNHLKTAFKQFLSQLPDDGLAVLCIEDDNIKSLLPDLAKPYLTYGFSKEADARAFHIKQTGLTTQFEVDNRGQKFTVLLNAPGKHNVLNALAAITLALQLNISITSIQTALKNFRGTGRRFEVLGQYYLENGAITLVDDYGHHPSEIAATMEAARSAWPDRRIVLAFQPHRYSRTEALFNDFVKVLAMADKLILLDIYPAGEAPIKNITSKKIGETIFERYQQKVIYLADPAKIEQMIHQELQNNDILLMQGAGSISTMAHSLAMQQSQENRKRVNE